MNSEEWWQALPTLSPDITTWPGQTVISQTLRVINEIIYVLIQDLFPSQCWAKIYVAQIFSSLSWCESQEMRYEISTWALLPMTVACSSHKLSSSWALQSCCGTCQPTLTDTHISQLYPVYRITNTLGFSSPQNNISVELDLVTNILILENSLNPDWSWLLTSTPAICKQYLHKHYIFLWGNKPDVKNRFEISVFNAARYLRLTFQSWTLQHFFSRSKVKYL